MHKGFEYARSQNPTRFAFERCVADLESGTRGFAFASGLAAIATVLELLDAGAHVVATTTSMAAPSACSNACASARPASTFSFVDLRRPRRASRRRSGRETRLIWVETPTNPLLKLADLAAVAALARAARHPHRRRQHLRQPLRPAAAGARLRHRRALDDQVPERPLRHGRRRASWSARTRSSPTAWPSCRTPSAPSPGPFDSFLALRGLKTLALRMERHCANALAIAAAGWRRHPRSQRVHLSRPRQPSAARARAGARCTASAA